MKNSALLLLGLALGSLLPLRLGSTAEAAALAPQEAPHLKPGQVLYGFDVVRGKVNIFDALAPATPLTIHGVEGDWALVTYPAQARGPEWVNFGNVITYRTEQ